MPKQYIAVDFGGTKISFALLDSDENIRELREYQGILGILAKESECRGFARSFTDDDELDYWVKSRSHSSSSGTCLSLSLSAEGFVDRSSHAASGLHGENIEIIDKESGKSPEGPVVNDLDMFDFLNNFGY